MYMRLGLTVGTKQDFVPSSVGSGPKSGYALPLIVGNKRH